MWCFICGNYIHESFGGVQKKYGCLCVSNVIKKNT